MAESSNMTDQEARRALVDELAQFNVRVGQPNDPPLFTKAPQSTMKPMHWRAADLRRLLDKIGENLKLEAGGIRRTLRLTNPGLPFGTTPTLWASIQVILPGEIATAHRHTASALRFIMEGNGADTIVDGEKYEMNEGDLVLTPSMTWHDHEHRGDRPMIWLDVLDITLVRSLHSVFFESSDVPRRAVSNFPTWSFDSFGSGIMRPRRAVSDVRDRMLVYPRARAEEAMNAALRLMPDPVDDLAMEYVNPAVGGPALATIGTALQMLRPGARCKAQRHTGSSVFYVIRGEGRTTVDDDVFDWGPGDFLAVPSWAKHRHENRSTSSDALMFQVNDIPVLKKLDLYFEENE